ncbi:hypothetical protein Hanom_Chr10g00895511 [Helianthus anomalus]
MVITTMSLCILHVMHQIDVFMSHSNYHHLHHHHRFLQTPDELRLLSLKWQLPSDWLWDLE